MITASANMNHMGNERLFGDLEFTVGISGFVSDTIVDFEPVKMYKCYLTQFKHLNDSNQQMQYLIKILQDLMRDGVDITPDTILTVISDKNNYAQYAETYSEYREKLKLQSEINREIKSIKFGNELNSENKSKLEELILLESELADEIKSLKTIVYNSYWCNYFGVSFAIDGIDVRVVIKQKRHRFSIKVKGEYIFYRNIWTALRSIKR